MKKTETRNMQLISVFWAEQAQLNTHDTGPHSIAQVSGRGRVWNTCALNYAVNYLQ